MHKNEPKQESNQATLARVKKEMDEDRLVHERIKVNVFRCHQYDTLEDFQGVNFFTK